MKIKQFLQFFQQKNFMKFYMKKLVYLFQTKYIGIGWRINILGEEENAECKKL